MKPMFALHKNGSGEVLDASAFKYEYELSTWMRNLDIRGGDTVEFRETASREEDLPEVLKEPKPSTDEDFPF